MGALISGVSIDMLWYWPEALDKVQDTCQDIWLFIKVLREKVMIEPQIIGYLGFVSQPTVKIESTISSFSFRLCVEGEKASAVFPQL